MRIHGFIQAHSSDFRCFSRFDGKAYLEHVVLKSRSVSQIQLTILVVPDCAENRRVFDDFATNHMIEVFYGDVENKLKRFIDCANEYKTDIIVRLPCAKPLFRPDLASSLIKVLVSNDNVDLVTVPSDFPKVFSCEVMRSGALSQLAIGNFSAQEKQMLESDPLFAAEQLLPSSRISIFEVGLPKISESEIELARELRRKELATGGCVLADSEKHLEQARYRLAAGSIHESDNVLDVACGSGIGCEMLSRAAKNGKIVGVDLEENREFERVKKNYPNVRFIVGDAMAQEFDMVFDKIVSFETIEHLERPKEFLLRLKGVLSADGLLICSVPARMNPAYLSRPLNPYHIKEYCAEELDKLLLDCGFITIKRFMQNEIGQIQEQWHAGTAGSFIAVCQLKSK